MTCREFERRAASLTLWELSQAREDEILGHAGECQQCTAWLQQQQTLAATMQTLRTRTADCTAGPNVEQALLQAFRQGRSQAKQSDVSYRFTPIAMRLSRFFEIGAYTAVAAAILVGLFLGVQLLEKRSTNLPMESQSAPPSASSPAVVAESGLQQQQPTVARNSVSRLRRRPVQSATRPSQETSEASHPGTDADYIALMLCDPLSCSSDAQVVRMELPSPGVTGSGGEQDEQVRVADVVVGYDGVVRAVRIVN
jgi:hypothetical protein